MAIEQSAGDETLARALRAMAERIDPIPDECTAAATAAFPLHTIDKELATLDYDSLFDDAPRSARAHGSDRHLTFVARNLCMEVDVSVDGLHGRLDPPAAADVELRWPGGSTSVAADEFGGFSVSAPPPGPVSLRCQRGPSDTTSPVVTDWVTL